MRFRPEVDYYEILQVHPRASQEMVKKAYRTLMGEMGGHPDLGGDGERAELINEAYTVLGGAEVRRAHHHARTVGAALRDRESTPLKSSHSQKSHAVLCLKEQKVFIR